MSTILLISRDATLIDAVQGAMPGTTHSVLCVESHERIPETARKHAVDLLILDLSAERREMSHTCRRVRAMPQVAKAPILALLDDVSAQDMAHVLDAGGDDCLRRPNMTDRELAARVRALLRRQNRPSANATPLVLNLREKTAQLYGRAISLTPTEFELLVALCENPGEYVTAARLLQRVWNYPSGVGDPALVRNHVRNLRRKLEPDRARPRVLTSAHGRGYAVSVNVQRR
jgi:DNA-binding response OmpR family regulator